MNWHSMTALQAAAALDTDLEKGITDIQSQLRLRSHGENKLDEGKKHSALRIFFAQFADFMIVILLLAAAVSFFTAIFNDESDFVDPVVILVIVILNAVIGTVQEEKAQKALDALKKLSAPQTSVIRNGRKKRIKTSSVVPGDLLVLSAGDVVPADARIISANGVKTRESALTGESLPCEKNGGIIVAQDSPPGDRRNMLFSSTAVLTGHCTALAVETGMNTQIGKIAGLLKSEEAPQTPLQLRLAKVSKLLGIGALIICGIIFIMGVLNRSALLDSFMLSISLAVAAIPEGLPAIVTVVLSLGVQRMAKSNAIVRRLPTVESLGAATVICSDKTGTLTQNKMTVTRICPTSGNQAQSKLLLSLAALCCNSAVSGSGKKLAVTGDPTENAIISAAIDSGIDIKSLTSENPRINEIPFDSSRKLMTTVHRTAVGMRQITKGAPDVLLGRCSSLLLNGNRQELTEFRRNELLRENSKMASQALRVIAVAYRDIGSASDTDENGLVFIGFLGMEDPPRKEVKAAVETCKKAGIVPVMITGDHVATAEAIAKQLGISENGTLSVTGSELDRMGEVELRNKIGKCRVFARVTPEHKVRIVKALRDNGEVVAMTGDGINDAPALKAADIGCAMGRSGTEVAKGAADMILTDDNFSTIVKAVAEGRGIYDNIKKAVHFLLSCNIGEILVIFAACLLKLPTPLLPIQLLWVNLVTDSLPAMALGVEDKEKDIMTRPPCPPNSSFFAENLGFDIAVEGLLVGALTLLAFIIGNNFFASTLALGRTMAFATLSLCELIHAVSVRSSLPFYETHLFNNKKMVGAIVICTLLQISVMTIPVLSSIFKTVPLAAPEWLTVLILAAVPFVIIESEKLMHKFFDKSKSV